MNNIISEIKVSNNIVLLCHNNPDGDAVGSIIAMYILLKRLGKEVDIILDTMPKRFNFLKEYQDIKKESTKKYDTAVILDTGSIDRVNSAYLLDTVSKKLVIDHHMTNTMYGDVNLVEEYPACCEIVYNLIKKMNVTLDSELAVPLTIGLLTDTGGFAHQNVLPSTFTMAAELSSLVDLSDIYKKVLRTITINQFNIKKKALDNLELYNNNALAVSFITSEDMEKYNVDEDECGILVGIPLEIDTVEVSILARIFKDKVRISLRSNNIDVNEVASIFGGAGHKNAAGITTNMPYEKLIKKLLEVLEGKIYEWNINSK